MFAHFLSHFRQQYAGFLALFIVLGGTSYAVATNSIGSAQIKNNSVQSKDIRNDQVSGADVRNRSLLAADFKAGQLPVGSAGPQGIPGPIGVTGPAGAAGPQGPKGDLSLPINSVDVPTVVAQSTDCFASNTIDEDFSSPVTLPAGTYLVQTNDNYYVTPGAATVMAIEGATGQTVVSHTVSSNGAVGGNTFGIVELATAGPVRVRARASVVGCGMAQLSGNSVTFVRAR